MNLRRIRAVVRKEMHEIARDPITIAVSLAMPLVMLFLFGYAISLDVKNVPLGVWDADRTPASRGLVDAFVRSGYFTRARTLADERDLTEAMQRGQIKLALIIPETYAERLARHAPAAVQLILDGTYSNTAQIIAGYADAIVLGAGRPAQPLLKPEIRVWYNPEMRSVNYVIPGLFGVILLAFPPLLTTLAVVREKESGSIQQIFASPLTSAEFIAGKLIPYGLIAFVQILLVMGFGLIWFEVPQRGGLGLLLSVSLLYVFCTVGLGLLVSTVTSRQVVAMLLALVLTLMPSFLFSGFLFPLFTMPYLMQWYAAIFPGKYFVALSRAIIMKGAGPADVWINAAMLLAYTLAVFGLAAARFRKKVA
jgi:drug efflux transport system permease protein